MQPCLGFFFGVDLDGGRGFGVGEMVEQADFGGSKPPKSACSTISPTPNPRPPSRSTPKKKPRHGCIRHPHQSPTSKSPTPTIPSAPPQSPSNPASTNTGNSSTTAGAAPTPPPSPPADFRSSSPLALP